MERRKFLLVTLIILIAAVPLIVLAAVTVGQNQEAREYADRSPQTEFNENISDDNENEEEENLNGKKESGLKINLPFVKIEIGEKGIKVDAPGTKVDVNKEGVNVIAPGTEVNVNKEGVKVDAPFTKVDTTK